jgi:hypothetical protein
MNNPTSEGPATREEAHAALFANLVMQHTNMAFIFLGRIPHPESGKTELDLDSAQFFIDQLEMIEAKTKGNLSKQEEGLLKQSLMSLRMAFVDATNKPAPPEETKHAPAEPAKPTETAAEAPAPEPPAGDDESRKKFSKKY